ncbi:ribose 5-phosphate isomerase B [Niallia sp. FSL W8-0635]|uniref:ribose 5-phosphate isomerase B n=1 Tax=Niallia sp. FSL W8-0635 TaxID=2975337 RepID=UPI002B0491CB|nr:ribose 5-phosphate isomerase B [Yersinia enterocolitica]
MKIAIASDHGGYQLKEAVKAHLLNSNIEVVDFGCHSRESVDFPDYAKNVGQSIINGENQLGILCCGTGIGMSIAANKITGIRAAVVGDVFSAKATREHNNSNILCLGERVTGEGLACLIVDTWLSAEFLGGRHANRINGIKELESYYC